VNRPRRRLRVVVALGLALVATAAVAAEAAAEPVPGRDVLYTSNADFDRGSLVNLNHDAPNANQLQLNESTGTFPFIWIALSVRCTIAKVNTQTGAILGEYRTVSDDADCNQSSRTTVALDGSVWVGHRGPGGVTHVALRELDQCVDRNGNGTIDTSTGYGDVKPWPGNASEVARAADECIGHHVDTNAVGLSDSRHMSIDAGNDLWVGDYSGGHNFVRIDGASGRIVTTPRALPCGGYGGLIDRNGVIWSAGGALLRWDPDAPDSDTNPLCIGIPNYGVAIDPQGWVWVTDLGGEVRKVSPDGATVLGPFPHGNGSAQGLAVGRDGDVWVSSSLLCGGGCTIGHLKNDGTFVGVVDTPTGAGSTGVAIDALGRIWSANYNSHTATRIDPTAGPVGADGTTRVGAVDLTVDFPAGPGDRPAPYPYNYSDMTGSQLLASVSQGSWIVTQDGGAAGATWGSIAWNTEPAGTIPTGAQIKVEARAADTEAGLGSEAFTAVANGAAFRKTGRFIQVRVTLTANDAGASPVLSDLRVTGVDLPPPTVEAITASCTGDTLAATATARGEVGSPFTLTLHASSDGTTFAATDRKATIALAAPGPSSYERTFSLASLTAIAYKVVSSTGVESNVVSASECGPGVVIPEAPIALLLPLSLLLLLGAAGSIHLRRRRIGAG
jgi:hypothetical protein